MPFKVNKKFLGVFSKKESVFFLVLFSLVLLIGWSNSAAALNCCGTQTWITPGTNGSDTCSSEYPGGSNLCKYASDDSTTTSWASNHEKPGWTQGDVGGSCPDLYFNLTCKRCISGVKVYAYMAETMDVLVWDGSNWITVVKNWTTSSAGWNTITFTEISGFFVKLYITASTQDYVYIVDYQVRVRKDCTTQWTGAWGAYVDNVYCVACSGTCGCGWIEGRVGANPYSVCTVGQDGRYYTSQEIDSPSSSSDYCASSTTICQTGWCPDYADWDGGFCTVRRTDCYDPFLCSYYGTVHEGNWDAFDRKCVECDYVHHTESNVCGDTNDIYLECNCGRREDANCTGTGDGYCESACGAAAACDEVPVGGSCGTGGTCDPSCQCVTTQCYIGGVYYSDGQCNPNSKCQYCNKSTPSSWSDVPSGKVCTTSGVVSVSATSYCNYDGDCDDGDCSGTKYYISCNGAGACRAATDHTDSYAYSFNASDGYVLMSGCSQGSPSSTLYCGTATDCTAGTCTGHKYYRACNGSGACRTDNTGAYDQTVNASAGYSLTLSCGTTGSTLCDSIWRASSGTGDNNYGAGGSYNCQGMCNGSGSCLYAVNCTGVPSGTLGCSSSTSTSITLSYSFSNGTNVSLFRESTLLNTFSGTSGSGNYTDSGLSASTSYNYYLRNGTSTSSTLLASATCTTQSAGNNPPTCNYLSPSPFSGNVPLNVIFTASGTDTDGTITQYEFDFGDGSSKVYSTTAGTTHTYSATGTYCATLRVQDNSGAWSTNTGSCPGGTCTAQITVTEAGVIISPQVITLGASGVTKTSATLNATLTDMGGASSCLVWFEWGTSGTPGVSGSYGNSTTPVPMAPGPFTAVISSLTAGQTYYFEAFAKNGGSW